MDTRARSRRDLVTNPAFAEVVELIKNQVTKETHSMLITAEGMDMGLINKQAGIVEGVKRVIVLLDTFRENSIGAPNVSDD